MTVQLIAKSKIVFHSFAFIVEKSNSTYTLVLTKLHNCVMTFRRASSSTPSSHIIINTESIKTIHFLFQYVFLCVFFRCFRKPLCLAFVQQHHLIAAISVLWCLPCKRQPIQFNNSSWTNFVNTNRNQSTHGFYKFNYQIVLSNIFTLIFQLLSCCCCVFYRNDSFVDATPQIEAELKSELERVAKVCYR